jgi:CRP/FNR family cyclic AMP-dependent transcriptional regulator
VLASKRGAGMTSEPGLTQGSVQSVRKDLSRRIFAAGATIFAEGEVGTLAYILLRGDATIFIGFGTPQQRTVTTLRSGQMFGVHALMAGANRTATAVTTQGCEVLAVSEAKLKQKLEEADPFLRYWVDYLSQRVIDLSAPA